MKNELGEVLDTLNQLKDEVKEKQKGGLLKIIASVENIIFKEDFNVLRLTSFQEEIENFSNTEELGQYVQNEILNIISDIEIIIDNCSV